MSKGYKHTIRLRILAHIFLAEESNTVSLVGGEEMEATTSSTVAMNTMPNSTPRHRASDMGTLKHTEGRLYSGAL